MGSDAGCGQKVTTFKVIEVLIILFKENIGHICSSEPSGSTGVLSWPEKAPVV